jgi:hypothetical protein
MHLVCFSRQTRQSFEPWHKNSKDLFVLDISREWVVSYEVVHRNERERWFVSIGSRNRSMSGRIRVVRGVCRSRLGDDRWACTMSDGRQAIWTIGEPGNVTGPRRYVFTEWWISALVLSPCITGRDRESVPVMIITRCRSVTTVGTSISSSQKS